MNRHLTLIALLLAGCKCDSTPKPAPAASGAPAPGSAVAARPKTKPVGRACHALGVAGAPRFAGKPIENGTRIDGSDFIELPEGARVTLKFDLTSRELTLIGPALARGCNYGDSVVALSRGVVETARGAGTRPGVEGGVATPAGAVSYGDANLRVAVDERATIIEVRQGEATLLGDEPASEGKKLLPSMPPTRLEATLDAEAQREICAKNATTAADLASALLKARAGFRPKDSASRDNFSARAAEHTRARRFARLRCAMAMAAAGAAPAAERAAVAAQVSATDDVWRRLKQPH